MYTVIEFLRITLSLDHNYSPFKRWNDWISTPAAFYFQSNSELKDHFVGTVTTRFDITQPYYLKLASHDTAVHHN